MKLCENVLCPRDSVQEVLDVADMVLSSNGGQGCIREIRNVVLCGKNQISLEKDERSHNCFDRY